MTDDQRARVRSALRDLLYPDHGDGERIPIFEWGHETTPTEEEMESLVSDLVGAVDKVL